MERSRWDRGGGQQRPQSLNTNVLLMPRCEGHQEHGLNEAFIVASVYNKARPPCSHTHKHVHVQSELARARTLGLGSPE